MSKQQNTPREKFIDAANRKKILAHRCKSCGHAELETVLFCEKCSGSKFEDIEVDGNGTVVTYTIQAVAPEGFEDAGSYAWVVFKVDGQPFRASGFLAGIKSPADLPLGTKVSVAGFDQKHGLILQKAK